MRVACLRSVLDCVMFLMCWSVHMQLCRCALLCDPEPWSALALLRMPFVLFFPENPCSSLALSGFSFTLHGQNWLWPLCLLIDLKYTFIF